MRTRSRQDDVAGSSPWPMVMPPDSVPLLLCTRLLAIWRLCAQPCTKMPPPPWELLVRCQAVDARRVALEVARDRDSVAVPICPDPQLLAVSSVVPSGNEAVWLAVLVPNGSGIAGKFTPLPRTVMAAPSYAPIRVGSCNSSARLPLRVASHPRIAFQRSPGRPDHGVEMAGQL